MSPVFFVKMYYISVSRDTFVLSSTAHQALLVFVAYLVTRWRCAFAAGLDSVLGITTDSGKWDDSSEYCLSEDWRSTGSQGEVVNNWTI